MANLSRGKRAVKESLGNTIPRKSSRRGMTPLEEAEYFIKAGFDKDCFEVKFLSKEIGSGVFAKTFISKGDFLLQYRGELLSKEKAIERENGRYKNERHSYLYFFKHDGKELCIHASRTYDSLGRMANDSTHPNCRMKKLSLGHTPYLALFALADVQPGEELVFDYCVEDLPWRNKTFIDSDTDYDSDPFDLKNTADDELENATDDELNNSADDELDNAGAGELENAAAGELENAAAVELENAANGELENAAAGELEIAAAGELENAAAVELENAAAGELENAADDELENAADDELESTGNGELENAAAGELENAAAGELENAADDELENAADDELESTGNGELENAAAGELENAAAGELENAAAGELENAADDELENAADDELESTGNGELENAAAGELENAAAGELENAAAGELENAADDELENAADDELESTGNGELENAAAGELENAAAGELENAAAVELENAADDELERSGNGELENAAAGEVENAAAGELENAANVELENAADELENAADDELNNSADDELKNSADDKLKNSADDELKNSANDELKNSADEELKNSANDEQKNSVDGKLKITAGSEMENCSIGESEYCTESASPLTVYATNQLAKTCCDNMTREKTRYTVKLCELSGEFVPVPDFVEHVENSNDSMSSNVFPNYGSELKQHAEAGQIVDLTERLPSNSDCESSRPTSDQFTHSLEVPVVFQCLICDKQFKKKGGLTMHMKKHGDTSKLGNKYHKPKRRCPFCQEKQTQLARHISNKHFEIPEVEEAMKLHPKSEERKEAFALFRKKAIYENNEKHVSLDTPEYECERIGQSDIICCSGCKGFYSRSLFYRHKVRCVVDSANFPTGVHVDSLAVLDSNSDFSLDVLSKFQNNEIGNMCRNDETIVLIGQRLLQRNMKKVDKTMETRKSVMQDMRLLARLYIAFCEFCPYKLTSKSEDMFIRTNFIYLEQIIEKVTKEDGNLKHGVKHAVFYLLRKCVDIIVAHYLSKGQDEKAKEIEKFLKVLNLNRDIVFGDAVYAINRNRQEKLRMPEQRASDEDIEKLSIYIQESIRKLSCQFEFVDKHDYVQLRDSVCSRLTLFNARRGEEPSRLKLSHFKDALNERWVDKLAVEHLDSSERNLFKELTIIYQTGKGNHLVPVLVPKDTLEPLKLLTDADIRERATVLSTNPYIFANTCLSVDHVHGWAAIHSMCIKSGVGNPELLTASKQRHRISTMYCALEVPEHERHLFYKHMGHSEKVNQGTYQYPLPILEVTKVGRHLQAFDKENCRKSGILEQTHTKDEIETKLDMNKKTLRRKAAVNDDTLCTDTDSSDYENQEKTVASKQPSKRFKWSLDLSAHVKDHFAEWIHLPYGNHLPGKEQVTSYLEKYQPGCTYRQMRTKIMNEQNKSQKTRKNRMKKMLRQ